jgi:TPR repeat protein
MNATFSGRALGALCLALTVASCATPGAEGREVRARDMPQAQKGDVDAQYRVGRSYCCGSGIAYSTERAVAWLCRAAVKGHRDAMFELADIYAGDIGTTAKLLSMGRGHQDEIKAYMWYTAAMVQGRPKAEARRAEVMRTLDDAELAEARRAATRWTQEKCPAVE